MIKNLLKNFDWPLFSAVATILALSFITFYGLNSGSSQFISRQAILVGAGMVIMFAVSFFDYRIFKNYSSPSLLIYFLSIVLLAAAFASREIRGVSSWIVLNRFTFQPAEFAKIAILILLAKYFSQRHLEINNVRHILVSGAYVFVPFIMIFTQPDFGSAFVFITIWFTMILFSGINKRHVMALIILATMIASIGWFFVLEDYQKDRVISFANPYDDPKGQGYHLIQSKIAIGSGGIAGNLFSGNKEYDILVPEPYTDFVFTSFANKFGFAGVVILIALFGFIMFRLISIAINVRNNFAGFFVVGYLSILLAHAVVNMGMNLGLLPITGIPLPFLSYGGSHLIVMLIGLGLVQSIRM